MRNLKAIFLLLLGCAVLAALHVALRIYGSDSARIVHRATLVDPGEGLEEVTRISILRDGQRMTLVKQARWRLTEPFAGSVDERAVSRLLDALAYTPVSDSETDAALLRNGRTRADFALEEPRLTVTLGAGAGGVSNVVSFGQRTPAKDGVYAALPGFASIFVMPTSVVAAVDLPVDAFRRRSVFLVGERQVEGIDIKRSAASRLAFVRDGDLWKVDGQRASSATVKNLAEQVLTASAVDFVWPVGATNEAESASASLLSVYGLDPESAATLTFKCQDGIDRQISFGKNASETTVYALVQNGGAVVTLPAALKDLALKDRSAYTDARLFPIEPASVASFALTEGGVELVLGRNAEGAWRIESPVAAPADPTFAAEVLENVLSLTSQDLAGKGVAVTVLTNAAPAIVRRERILGERRLEDLRSREILRMPPETVRRIVVTRSAPAPASPLAIVCGRETKAWSIETEGVTGVVGEKAVNALLAALNPLFSARIVKLKVSAEELEGYGLDKPAFILAIDQDRADAVRRNVLLGAETEGGRYATVGSSDAVFVVSETIVSLLTAPLVER